MATIEETKRGASYDYEKMIDLYYSGKSYTEIANLMNTKSVQSVRHGIERTLRERRAMVEREKKLKDQAKFEESRVIKEKQRSLKKRKKSRQLGLFQYIMHPKTLIALKSTLNELYESSVLIDEIKGEILISESLDMNKVGTALLERGFLVKLVKKQSMSLKEIKIKTMFAENSLVNDSVGCLNEIFWADTDEDTKNDLKLSLKSEMESGDIIFNGESIEDLDKSITPGYVRKKINSTGYVVMICYRPLEIIKRLGQTTLAINGEVLYVMNYVSIDDLIKVIESAWDSLFFAVANVKRLLEISGVRKVNANDVYKKLVANFNKVHHTFLGMNINSRILESHIQISAVIVYCSLHMFHVPVPIGHLLNSSYL